MPNLVGELTIRELDGQIEGMGSCVVLNFDKLTVEQASLLRRRFREESIAFKVVKNRLAMHALKERGFELGERIRGKCGVAFAPEEKAITAAKLIRDFQRENREIKISVLAGVVEGEVIEGDGAKIIADMPDKDTVRAQIAMAISGPARQLVQVLSALPTGLARCLEQRGSEGDGSESQGDEES